MRTLKISALVIGMMTLAITGCKKENVAKQETTNTETTSDPDISALALQAEAVDNSMEAVYNQATEDFTMENEGIAADFLVDATDVDADENATSANDAKRKHIKSNSFIFCLRKLDLHCDQKAKIKILLGEYKDCRESAIKRARAIYHELYAKYKTAAQEQEKLYRAGKITKDQLAERLERLRKAFQKDLAELKLKEKLDVALKTCYRKFLIQLKGTLGEKLWIQFVCCYKGH